MTATSGSRCLLLGSHCSLLNSATSLLLTSVCSGVQRSLPFRRSDLLDWVVGVPVSVRPDRRAGLLGCVMVGITLLDRHCLAVLASCRGRGEQLTTGWDALSRPVAAMIARCIQTCASLCTTTVSRRCWGCVILNFGLRRAV